VLPIARLVELKLASGMSSLDRARDLADVVELIRHARLARELGDTLASVIFKLASLDGPRQQGVFLESAAERLEREHVIGLDVCQVRVRP